MKGKEFKKRIENFLEILKDDEDVKIYHKRRWKSEELELINIEERINENGERYWQIF